MIFMNGPGNGDIRLIPTADGKSFDTQPVAPFEADASTLGEALAIYQAAFNAKITPYDGTDPDVPFVSGEEPKYFVYEDHRGGGLVDIHVIRQDVEICPKQNLLFPLLPGDHIKMGMLAC